jgi:hypothetical protein
MLTSEQIGNELNRSIKLAIDSGEASTIAEARAIFEGYKLGILVGPDVASSPTKQVALLTAINTARRCFLGGVTVEIQRHNANLLVPWRDCQTLEQAIYDLGGATSDALAPDSPTIVLGDVSEPVRSDFALRATFEGWVAGVAPFVDEIRLSEIQEFSPSGVLAGALAVSEAFQYVRGRNAFAGRRAIGLSLWKPDSLYSWIEESETGPELECLPSKCWLIGLGHLGQAYLWTLGFLPYANPETVQLVIQDYDALVLANDSTSLLTNRKIIGQKKTHAMAQWCAQRGFRTRIVERRFAANFEIDEEEPQVALCGVDNQPARAALEDVGFAQIIEAGLGRGTEEYLAFQMHCFPAERSARDRWSTVDSQRFEDVSDKPAYESLAAEGLDKCGLTMLANRSVGASFVGAFTSTLVISELLRMSIGAERYAVIDGTLRSPQSFQFARNVTLFDPFNPGVTAASKKERHSALFGSVNQEMTDERL